MRRFAICSLLILTACNQVLGIEQTIFADAAPALDVPDAPLPDVDGDGVPDVDDLCLASPSDALGTVDGDSIPNGMDPCPLDNQMTGDADGDSIQDRCDPFPSAGGDRYRCLMVFKNPDLNRLLWVHRPGQAMWNTGTTGLLTANQGPRATLIAAHDLAPARTVTYDVWISVNGNTDMSVPHRLRVLARADATTMSDAGDVGCEISGRTSPRLSIVGAASASMPLMFSTGVFRVRVTLEPAGTGVNLRCTASRDLAPAVTISATVPVSAGNFGVDTDGGASQIFGIAIYDRDDAPPL